MPRPAPAARPPVPPAPAPARRAPLTLTEAEVARTLRPVADPGPEPGWTLATDEDYAVLARQLMAGHSGPLWIFAYGSLIWNPGFATGRIRPATAQGWHRAFQLEIRQWRGSPEIPGLMLALAPGGSCNGLAIEVAPGHEAEGLLALLRREMPAREHLGEVRWITLRAEDGRPLRALTFWTGTRGESVVRLPLETQAWRLAHACGHGGSGAQYLRNTVAGLEAHGLRDRNLWRLQQMVSDEIRRWDRQPEAGPETGKGTAPPAPHDS